ncbi:B-cell linker protein isoform X1 [Sparus aurata]|uniref:B cell linker n=1 Tax=Sparus aurata TaxID=8175 RepID=A0A671V1A2_SPAAU|nr:B-cell linker protein isoform X1 [Sparus aurata]
MNLPSREECEGWDEAQVAFFMCKNQMQECAATVNRLRINGQRLLSLSDSEMSKFSLIHQPQLQKIVQDIKKNDGSLLNKLRRLKGKPLPKVPARDYRDDDQQSEPDYDNDMYEDPHEEQDDSYEPPPSSHRVFTTTPSASFPTGEYLDNCRNRPQRPPRKPLRPVRASKQLPPEPTQMTSDEEDYINPDGSNDDDNYIEPSENPPTKSTMHGGTRAGRDLPMLPTPSPECPPSPDLYEVPDQEQEKSLPLPVNRLPPIPPTKQSHSLPPKPSPRLNMRRSPHTVQEPTGEDEYEVCDPDDSSNNKSVEAPPILLPKPLPRERSPKPPVKPKPELKPREFESHTLPLSQTEPKPQQKAFTLDMKRPKIPLPQFTSLKTADRGSVSAENESTDQDKDADVYKKSWYANTCDRKTADDVLFRLNIDGAFMVRKSSGQDAQQPYTLVVFYKGRVYNIPVRYIPTTQQYALGREKKGEEHFSTVSHIIENHQRHSLVLIDSQNNTKDATKLCYPVKP